MNLSRLVLRLFLLWVGYCVACVMAPAAYALDPVQIQQLTGLSGTLDEHEGVFKVGFPRNDIKMTVAGTRLLPDQGLAGWAAFTPVGNHVMVMGDIVLLENEINPVLSAALDNGLEVTALHNHFLWDSPKVMFMHIGGMGNETDLARAVGRVFGKLKEVIATKPRSPATSLDPANTSFDPDSIRKIVGVAGVFKNGVYKVVVGRKATMAGHEVGKEMGINTWAAFAGSDQQAVVDGDIAMHETEVQDVLKALRKFNISIVSIHNHMIGEAPRYVFLHYWGIGPLQDLATGFKAALDAQSDR